MATHITIPMARLIELETAEHERDILRTENAALKREAHTWSKAAETYARPRMPLDPIDVEDMLDEANQICDRDGNNEDAHMVFARLLQRTHGIEAQRRGHRAPVTCSRSVMPCALRCTELLCGWWRERT